ncbi:MAG: MFS transporter, partial [bacterium]
KKDNVQCRISEDEKFKISDLRELKSLAYWLVSISCIFGYMGFDGYCLFSADMLETRFGMGEKASFLYSMPSFVSIFLSPLVGHLVDKFGCRVRFLVFSLVSVYLATVTTTLIPAADNPDDPQWLTLIPLFLLGVGYCIYVTVLWSCIPYVVPKKLLATGYGLTDCLCNLC